MIVDPDLLPDQLSFTELKAMFDFVHAFQHTSDVRRDAVQPLLDELTDRVAPVANVIRARRPNLQPVSQQPNQQASVVTPKQWYDWFNQLDVIQRLSSRLANVTNSYEAVHLARELRAQVETLESLGDALRQGRRDA